MNHLRPALLDLLARDYALGTLQGRARRRFETLLQQAPAARQAVAGWQRQFDVLAAAVPAMQPRAAVWAGIEQRLFAAAPAAPAPPRGWRAWFSGPVVAAALAGVLASVLVAQQQPGWLGLETAQEGLPASYVGLLNDGNGRATVLASARRHGRELTVKLLQPVAVPAGQVAQLWALPRDGSAAFPVGVVPAQGSAKLRLADSAEKLFFGVSQLAVSFEPAAAAPGSVPSGAFVLRGACARLW